MLGDQNANNSKLLIPKIKYKLLSLIYQKLSSVCQILFKTADINNNFLFIYPIEILEIFKVAGINTCSILVLTYKIQFTDEYTVSYILSATLF